MKMLQLMAPAIMVISAAFVGTAQAATTNGFANGGFEIDGIPATRAASWTPAASGYSRSTDARTGNYSLQLMSPQLNAAVALQNSSEVGLPPLTAGDNPLLSFWAKGYAGDTGNVSYALRYLDAGGGVLADSTATQFQALINESDWTEITGGLGPVPVGAVGAFIEFSQAIGPIGFDPPSGGTFLGGTVLIDDVYLGVVQTIPEPTSASLLGLGGLGLLIRRRRRR